MLHNQHYRIADGWALSRGRKLIAKVISSHFQYGRFDEAVF